MLVSIPALRPSKNTTINSSAKQAIAVAQVSRAGRFICGYLVETVAAVYYYLVPFANFFVLAVVVVR
jgi:hypothetical protein